MEIYEVSFYDYLSIRLSHQNGMLINVIPALFASSCFILSLACISANGLLNVVCLMK